MFADLATVSKTRRWWPLRLVVVLGLVIAVLTQLNIPVRTPVGAAGVGTGSHPVVEVAGLGSDGTVFAKLTASLRASGTTVLDFDAARAGTQPLVYRPRAGIRIPALADGVVAPAIRGALERAGLARDATIDVVTHSTGGLLMRYLVEKRGWADRVDDLVLVAVPNHGSDVVAWETNLGDNPMGGLGDDMTPGSAFLDSLGYAEPNGEVYTTIGGDPWFFRWLRYGQHGFDDQVPAESPFLAGAANNTYPHAHGRLLRAEEVVRLVVRTLAAR